MADKKNSDENYTLKELLIKIKPYFFKYIKPNLIYYVEVFGALFISNLVSLIMPFLSKLIIDDALISKDFKLLIILISITAGTSIIMEVGSAVTQYFYTFLIEQINFRATRDVYNHILKLSLNFFDNTRVGEVTKRIGDARSIHGFMRTFLFNFFNNLFLVTINFAACIFINPYVSLVLVFYIPFFIFYNKRVGKLSRELEKERWQQEKVISSEQSESIFGIRTIKAFAIESRVFRKLKWLILKLRKLRLTYERKFIYFGFLYTIFHSFENFFIVLIAGIFIINDKMSIGEFIAFLTISSRIFSPLKSLIDLNRNIQVNVVEIDRLNETMSNKQERQKASEKINVKKGEIKFVDVDFEYFKGQNVLKKINLTINKGEMVALVGISGVGKSTIANLIGKYYTPTGGKILIDNIDINEYDVKTLRDNIGFVLQNVYLFNGSIMDNLKLCGFGKTEEDIFKACKEACAYDFIMEMPEKYDTKVGEQGVKLSGGQKQRIAIAQALLKDPKILILDEATSHLDLETESLVQKALHNLMKNKTSVVIAHRLSTIKKADFICVIDKGAVIEIGKHDELIKKNGFYKKLYEKTAVI